MSVFDDMKLFYKTAWPARNYIVPCAEGPAGIGKTAALKEAALELKEEGFATGKVVTIIASQILPNEVSGITMPVVESKAMEIFDHFRLSSLKDGDILFFDELLEADELVLSACLTLIESRELMSGRKLPDVMIAAATNPTIKPNMLKENIRQRFVWRKFGIDYDGCHNYILNKFGVDLPGSIISKIKPSGDEYNILTPRSLTKMVAWICEAGDNSELINQIAMQINCIWNLSIGTEIRNAYLNRSMDYKIRSAIKKAVHDNVSDDLDDSVFEQTSITELMEKLQSLPEWNDIENSLSSMEFNDPSVDEINF